MPPGKPPFTKNARSSGIMLIICAIVTAAAIITVCFRHFRFDFPTDGAFQSLLSLLPLLSFYLIPIIGPIFILSLSLYLKRSASPVDAVLLIFPIGCAIGCLCMCDAPADNHDGEILGMGLLTVLWGIISIPLCCISFFTKETKARGDK